MVYAHTLNKAVCSFQIFGVFPVVLHEASHVLQNLFVRIYHAQHIAFAYRGSCRATNIDFPLTSFDCYRAQVFDSCLSTVTGAPRDCKLHLVRRLNALEASLDLNTQVGTIAQTVATKLRTYACLTGAERLGVGMTRRHTQVLPD